MDGRVLLVLLCLCGEVLAAPVLNSIQAFTDATGNAVFTSNVLAPLVGTTNIIVVGSPVGSACTATQLAGFTVFDDANQTNWYDGQLDTFSQACLNTSGGGGNVRIAIFSAVDLAPYSGSVRIIHELLQPVMGYIINASGITGLEVSDTSIQCESGNACAAACTAGHACAGPAPVIRRTDNALVVCPVFAKETATAITAADGSTALSASFVSGNFTMAGFYRIESPPTDTGIDADGVGANPWAAGCYAFTSQ